MVKSLGPGQASLLRQEARLARIRSLEKEIRALQSQAVKVRDQMCWKFSVENFNNNFGFKKVLELESSVNLI